MDFFFGDSGGERLATRETEAEARAENSDEPGRYGCPAIFKTEKKENSRRGNQSLFPPQPLATTDLLRVPIVFPFQNVTY